MTGRVDRKLRAAVVGVGKVGSRFDEEEGRTTVWSHVGAYLERPHVFDLVAVCDPDPLNAEAFRQRCPDVPVYASLETLLAKARADVVSICTPPDSHGPILDSLLSGDRPQLVWCEKPLATDFDTARRMVDACSAADVRLIVSHVRRWVPLWRRLRSLVKDGAVGTVRCVRVAMGNRLLSIGSHAVDLLLYLGGRPRTVVSLDIPELYEDDEPARAALVAFDEGGYGIVQVSGRKSNLVIEAEVLGDAGRLVAREQDGTITFEPFIDSLVYAGYRQLAAADAERHATLSSMSPFLAIADDIPGLIADRARPAPCEGSHALDVQAVLAEMAAAQSDAASQREAGRP